MPQELSGVRASDADRERVAAILRDAAGQGLLTLDEVDQRLAAVYAARHLTELAPLTADLPAAGRRLAPADRGASARTRAVARAHLAGYLGIVALLVAIWVATGADSHFWPIWPALGMLPGVVSHLAAVRHAEDPSRGRTLRVPGGCGARAIQQARERQLAA
jgi:peptidoglycan/LPS O-acetylase OafA/YrhL